DAHFRGGAQEHPTCAGGECRCACREGKRKGKGKAVGLLWLALAAAMWERPWCRDCRDVQRSVLLRYSRSRFPLHARRVPPKILETVKLALVSMKDVDHHL